MANCPNCGSDHIQLITETNVNWGATAGLWALADAFDMSVYGVATKETQANCCLNCGNKWLASDLYYAIQMLETLLEIKIDLSQKNDRSLLNQALPIFNTYSKKISSKSEHLKTKTTGTLQLGCLVWFVAIGLTLFAGVKTPILYLLIPTGTFFIWGFIKNMIEISNKNRKIEAEEYFKNLEESMYEELYELKNQYDLGVL